MPGHRQSAAEHREPRHDSERFVFLGSLLQGALRAVLIVFIAITLFFEPPNRYRWICVCILAAYLVIVGSWSLCALRPGNRAVIGTSKVVSLLVIGADVAVVSILSVLTGMTAPL